MQTTTNSHNTDSTTNNITVSIGTKSDIKLNATKRAFASAFPNAHITILTCDAQSKINDQPVGFQETMRGAYNRLQSTKHQHHKSDFFVAIENGIIKTGVSAAEWIDLAWVIVEDSNSKQWVATSGGLPFATLYVDKAHELGFDKNTAGDVMARALSCNTKDPHSYLTFDKVTREDYLVQALLSALGQYLRSKASTTLYT